MKWAPPLAWICSMACLSMTAHAQEVPPAPAVPAATAVAVDSNAFPVLPPSRKCMAKDLNGIAWKLAEVYERPAGKEKMSLTAEPHQYVFFAKEGTYKAFKTTVGDMPQKDVLANLKRVQGDPLQQYIIHDSGFLYLYDAGIAGDTWACFIVANALGQFTPGQMLLMPPAPPEGTVEKVRLLKVYKRYWAPGPPMRRIWRRIR